MNWNQFSISWKSGFDLSASWLRNEIYFFITAMPKISFYYFRDTKPCAKHTKSVREFHLFYWNHVCKVNEWCLVNCFHSKFRVSMQIIVRNYCIAKCKRLSVCSWILMNLRGIFFSWFKLFMLIQTMKMSDFLLLRYSTCWL